MRPGKPRRRGRSKKLVGAKGVAQPRRKKLPLYEMPKTKREFYLDVEVGKWLLEFPDALTKTEIIKRFRTSGKKFDERAIIIAPLLKEHERMQIIDLLLEMGRERAAKKQ